MASCFDVAHQIGKPSVLARQIEAGDRSVDDCLDLLDRVRAYPEDGLDVWEPA